VLFNSRGSRVSSSHRPHLTYFGRTSRRQAALPCYAAPPQGSMWKGASARLSRRPRGSGLEGAQRRNLVRVNMSEWVCFTRDRDSCRLSARAANPTLLGSLPLSEYSLAGRDPEKRMHLGASFGIEMEHPIIGAVPLLRPLSPALPSCASHSCNRAQWLS
jgi:hypothetical protein